MQPTSTTTTEFPYYEEPHEDVPYYCHEADNFTMIQIICRCVIMPLVCFVGIFANCINAAVFTQKSMRKQTFNYFFLALSMSDVIVLISALMVFVLPAVAEILDWLPMVNLSSRMVIVFYPIGQTALTSSVYLTVMIALHRFIAIGHPFVAARHCYSTKFVWRLIILVIAFAFAFNGSRWAELSLSTCFNRRHNLNEIEIMPTELMMDRRYTVYYRNTAYSMVQFFIPFVLLIVLNFKICLAVKKSQQCTELFSRENRSTRDDGSEGNSPRAGTPKAERRSKKKQSRDINRMLTSIIVFFLFFNILGLFNNAMELAQMSIPTFDTLLIEMASICVDLNAASTSFNYWWYGSKYRDIVKKCLYNTFGIQSCRPETIRPTEFTRFMVTRYHDYGHQRATTATTAANAILEEVS